MGAVELAGLDDAEVVVFLGAGVEALDGDGRGAEVEGVRHCRNGF